MHRMLRRLVRSLRSFRRCVGAQHLYCFNPPLRSELPEDEKWFCDFCVEHGFNERPYTPAGIGCRIPATA